MGGGWNPTTFGSFVFSPFYFETSNLKARFLWMLCKPQNPDTKKLWKYQTLLVTRGLKQGGNLTPHDI